MVVVYLSAVFGGRISFRVGGGGCDLEMVVKKMVVKGD